MSGYKTFERVWNLPQTGPDFWKNMDMTLTVLPEHKLFRSAAKELREEFGFWIRPIIKKDNGYKDESIKG